MSDVIDVLEKMGQDARWTRASQEDIQSALTEAEITPELRAAIAEGDQSSLRALLDLVPLCGMYVPGKEDEEEDEDTEEAPPAEDDEKPEHSLSQVQIPAG
jgi:hypothetical protein